MKRNILIGLVALCVIVFAVGCADETAPAANPDVTNMKNQLASMQGTVSTMQAQLVAIAAKAAPDVSGKLDKAVYDAKMVDLEAKVNSATSKNAEQTTQIDALKTQVTALETWKTTHAGSGTTTPPVNPGNPQGVVTATVVPPSPGVIYGGTAATGVQISTYYVNVFNGSNIYKYCRMQTTMSSQNSLAPNIDKVSTAVSIINPVNSIFGLSYIPNEDGTACSLITGISSGSAFSVAPGAQIQVMISVKITYVAPANPATSAWTPNFIVISNDQYS